MQTKRSRLFLKIKVALFMLMKIILISLVITGLQAQQKLRCNNLIKLY